MCVLGKEKNEKKQEFPKEHLSDVEAGQHESVTDR